VLLVARGVGLATMAPLVPLAARAGVGITAILSARSPADLMRNEFLRGAPAARFELEELFACGDRCTTRWRYSWGDGHIRGVDVFRVRDGKVAEKLSYVKG